VGEQAEFFQYEFGAAQALGVFVVHVLGEERDDFIAAGELALYTFPDGQSGLLAVEVENLVDRVKEFLGLARSDFDFGLWRFFLWSRRLSRFLPIGCGDALIGRLPILLLLSGSLSRLILRREHGIRDHEQSGREQTDPKKQPKNPRGTLLDLIH
jgi:hypothetical protein